MPSALVPSGATSFTLAPCASRTFAASICPLRTANRNGVKPLFDFAFTSAPNSISIAGSVGVAFRCRPHQRGLAFPGLLGVDIRAVHQQQFHRIYFSGERRGHQRGLALLGVALGSAPAFRKRSIMAASPLVQASESGVML